jgi:hypothetical protein
MAPGGTCSIIVSLVYGIKIVINKTKTMKSFFSIIFFMLFSFLLKAQEEKFKAVFIYSFTQHVEWPASVSNTDFIICVLGETKITDELKDIASSKKVANKRIIIAEVKAGQPIPACHILFIPKGSGTQVASSAKALGNRPVLIISDTNDGCKAGAGINFVRKNQNLNFQISKSNIIPRGLVVDVQLLSLGINVE